MTPSYKSLHKDFKLNGLSYSKVELEDLADSFAKEGLEHKQAIGNFLQDWLDESESIKVTTSGSTGKPKEISLKKSHMVNSAVATGNFFELKPKDTALLCLPADYIAGKMMLVRAMILGLELDYIEPSSNPLKRATKEYDFCAMVPLQVENSLKKIDHIKTLIVGGAPLSSALKVKIQNTRCQIFETYGMTETITHIAVKKVNKGTGNSFKTLSDITVSIDERDCLVIEAPKIANDPIRANDIVNIISDTTFEWLGRYDNIINSGGVKLIPEQIERKLATVIGSRFFVTGLPDEKLGQRLVLVVEGVIDPEELLQKIKASTVIERFEAPKKIYCISKFAVTDTGKIRRAENIGLIPR